MQCAQHRVLTQDRLLTRRTPKARQYERHCGRWCSVPIHTRRRGDHTGDGRAHVTIWRMHGVLYKVCSRGVPCKQTAIETARQEGRVKQEEERRGVEVWKERGAGNAEREKGKVEKGGGEKGRGGGGKGGVKTKGEVG